MEYTIRDAAAPRFADEFELIWSGQGAEPPAGAQYVGVLRQVLDRMKIQFDQDPKGEEPAARSLLAARLKAHKDTISILRKEAEQVIANALTPERAAIQAPIWLGRHNLRVERLSGSLFYCALILDGQHAVDLDISITEGLPPPQDKPLPAQQTLFTDITSALTIVKTVYESVLDKRAARSSFTSKARWKGEKRRAQHKLDKYVRDLKGIADVGLKDGFVDMATLALASLKSEFVSMEAPRIKNGYVWNLGLWSAGFAILALVVTWLSTQSGTEFTWLPAAIKGIYPFAIASIGAAIGTWLSFSIRRVGLTFEQLAIPEEDMLHPAFRVLFVLGLTLVVMLIFFTGVMNIEIGGLKTTSFTGATTNLEAVSLLVGLFCGIAERGLSSAVSLRANDFVSSIGGKRAPWPGSHFHPG